MAGILVQLHHETVTGPKTRRFIAQKEFASFDEFKPWIDDVASKNPLPESRNGVHWGWMACDEKSEYFLKGKS